MIKSNDLHELALTIADRSICNVKVGAIIYDSHGIFAWGWNHVGTGRGQCAEQHAISRANRGRLSNASIMITSIRKGKIINSTPCPKCMNYILKAHISKITCASAEGEWITYHV
jgi:deoxycytidylate deaminase